MFWAKWECRTCHLQLSMLLSEGFMNIEVHAVSSICWSLMRKATCGPTAFQKATDWPKVAFHFSKHVTRPIKITRIRLIPRKIFLLVDFKREYLTVIDIIRQWKYVCSSPTFFLATFNHFSKQQTNTLVYDASSLKTCQPKQYNGCEQ